MSNTVDGPDKDAFEYPNIFEIARLQVQISRLELAVGAIQGEQKLAFIRVQIEQLKMHQAILYGQIQRRVVLGGFERKDSVEPREILDLIKKQKTALQEQRGRASQAQPPRPSDDRIEVLEAAAKSLKGTDEQASLDEAGSREGRGYSRELSIPATSRQALGGPTADSTGSEESDTFSKSAALSVAKGAQKGSGAKASAQKGGKA